MQAQVFQIQGKFPLENGKQLIDPVVAYHTFGQINAERDNIIWACHALTANSNVFEWWPGLFGDNELFNPGEHFIVCANILGSHYGTTGPLSDNPITGEKYYHDFPQITIRDMVGMHKLLAKELGIEKIKLILGGSMGGQQAMEWAIMEPSRFENAAFIATSAAHTPWGVAFNESQRMAIEVDPTWKLRTDQAGIEGMKTARSIALLSYRNYQTYGHSQKPTDGEMIYPDRAPSYQRYQGKKLARRFNAFSYWHLSKAMDSHNIGRKRNGIENALSKIRANVIVLSLERDLLFPLADQLRIWKAIPGSTHHVIPSIYGHDGFLLETKKISAILYKYLQTVKV